MTTKYQMQHDDQDDNEEEADGETMEEDGILLQTIQCQCKTFIVFNWVS